MAGGGFGGNIVEMLQESADTALGYALNLGNDIATIETVLINVIVPAVGILISMWGVWDFMQMRNPRSGKNVTGTSVAIRFAIGPATIQLVAFMRALSVSFFGDRTGGNFQRDAAASYVADAQSAVDPTSAGLLMVLAFLVLVGWIAGLRAMVAFARMGNPGQDGYELFRTGAARLIAGTVFASFQFVMDDIFASATGETGTFSSELNT